MQILRRSALALVLGAGAASAQPPPPEAPAPTPPAPEAPAAPETPAPVPAITVSGRVIDSLGRPVRGAKVGIEGTEDRVETDKNGRFTVSAPIGATLVIESPLATRPGSRRSTARRSTTSCC